MPSESSKNESEYLNLDVKDLKKRQKKDFNFEEFIYNFRIPLTLALLGAILIGLGLFIFKNGITSSESKIEVIESATGNQDMESELVVEISGSVVKPGVYKLPSGSRVEDLLITSGGLTDDADRIWIEKNVNRALKLTDGQKVYIPKQSEVLSAKISVGTNGLDSAWGSGSQNKVNINTASQKQLEDLSGIGPVYANNIIEQRPYSNIEELLSKGVLKKNVYEKIKNEISVY